MTYPFIVCIMGPTASGKTSLAIELAHRFPSEVISVDSALIYRGMDIGTAKPSLEERQGIPHHLIDILDPDEDFNVAIFKDLVYDAIDKIKSNGHIPIMVGGTGFYIQAVLKNVNFSEGESDPGYRKELEEIAISKGAVFLHEKLKQVDPESAENIPAGNVKRVIRALEYYKVTGNLISEHNKEESEKPAVFDNRYFVLNDERGYLYERIDKRVDQMMASGLLEEVRRLYESGISRDAVSMQSLGYRQLLDYFYGEYSLEEAVYQIKLQTRHFAKRQITWFKREKDAIWINKNEFDHDDSKILEFMMTKI